MNSRRESWNKHIKNSEVPYSAAVSSTNTYALILSTTVIFSKLFLIEVVSSINPSVSEFLHSVNKATKFEHE